MANRLVFSKSGTITADTTWEFDPLDLSRADVLDIHLELTGNSTGTSPTLNVYLQSRGPDGIWKDRVAFTQLTDAHNDGEILDARLLSIDSYSEDEEESEPYGSTGASHLTAGTVRHGPFPGVYRGAITGGVGSGNTPGASWRFEFDAGGTSPSFPVVIYVTATSAL